MAFLFIILTVECIVTLGEREKEGENWVVSLAEKLI